MVLKIKRIISNIELDVEEEDLSFEGESFAFKYLLKLEFSHLYEAVWTALKNGRCIGIYPEGGSHDRL